MKKFLCLILTVILLLTTAVILPASATETSTSQHPDTYIAPVFYGVQFAAGTAANTQNIRFVSVLPSSDGEVVGYEIYAKYKDETVTKYVEYSVDQNDAQMETNTVYSSVRSGNFAAKTADELGTEMGIENPYGIMAIAINGVPSNQEIRLYVHTYVKVDGEVMDEAIFTGFKVDGNTATLISTSEELYNQGGMGTKEYPYVLTQENFEAFYKKYSSQNFSSKEYFSLESDVSITMDTIAPIGNFLGDFNGNGHTISGLRISGTGHAGLFATLHEASVSNLRLINTTITSSGVGYTRIGGIVGNMQCGSTISNCYVEATVTATGAADTVSAGGIVGMMNSTPKCVIENSQFYGTVTCTAGNAAGIVGKVNNGTAGPDITNCTFGGTASGRVAGYILGMVEAADCSVTNCVIDRTCGRGTLRRNIGIMNTSGFKGTIGHVDNLGCTVNNVTVNSNDSHSMYLAKGYDLSPQITLINSMSPSYGLTSDGKAIPWVQGGCTDGTYYYYFMITEDSSKCVILKYDIANQTMVSKSEELDLGHANDAAYNPNNQTIAVADCKGKNIIHILDAQTLKLKETKNLGSEVTASITYDNIYQQYLVVGYQNNYVYVYDNDFNYVKTITSFGVSQGIYDGEYSMQGVLTDGIYLYILEWHGGSRWKNENVTIEGEVSSRILVMDLSTGELVETVELGIKREVENLIVWNGSFYIVCNNLSWNGAECYRVNIVPEGAPTVDSDETGQPQYLWFD